MSRATRVMAGLILISIPTIAFGGYFLLTSLIDKNSGYAANALRQDFFRAGHAHAGVITILSLVGQILVDAAALSPALQWLARLGPSPCRHPALRRLLHVHAAPHGGGSGPHLALIYAGALLLVVSVLTLGIGLLRSRP